ncbi:hypothetical protein SUGI_0584730 [Cryptomeria japonica]|nr:hypothetical protein SUGI_0584730 [Cryptomeria japonica]
MLSLPLEKSWTAMIAVKSYETQLVSVIRPSHAVYATGRGTSSWAEVGLDAHDDYGGRNRQVLDASDDNTYVRRRMGVQAHFRPFSVFERSKGGENRGGFVGKNKVLMSAGVMPSHGRTSQDPPVTTIASAVKTVVDNLTEEMEKEVAHNEKELVDLPKNTTAIVLESAKDKDSICDLNGVAGGVLRLGGSSTMAASGATQMMDGGSGSIGGNVAGLVDGLGKQRSSMCQGLGGLGVQNLKLLENARAQDWVEVKREKGKRGEGSIGNVLPIEGGNGVVSGGGGSLIVAPSDLGQLINLSLLLTPKKRKKTFISC